jgi:tRNA G18 (ribose-2'-O)-methylase SpoU
VVVKGKQQVEHLLTTSPDLRFKEILIPADMKFDPSGPFYRTHRIHRVPSELLYYISYHSKPLPSGRVFGGKDELSDEDKKLLADPTVADSLVIGSLPHPKLPLPESPRVVLCIDQVVFPDNVGTLIRTAASLGLVDAIIGTKGTCDFYGWKVLEASGASGFHIPTKSGLSSEEVINYSKKHNLFPIVGNSNSGADPRSISVPKGKDGIMLIIGNERHGPDPTVMDIGFKARIPINERMNSLNAGVAGGILLQLVSTLV